MSIITGTLNGAYGLASGAASGAYGLASSAATGAYEAAASAASGAAKMATAAADTAAEVVPILCQGICYAISVLALVTGFIAICSVNPELLAVFLLCLLVGSLTPWVGLEH